MTACIEPADVARVLAGRSDDAQRRHVESCPACRALVGAYREFMDPGGEPPAGMDEARERVDAALSSAMGAASSSRVIARRGVWMMAAALCAAAGLYLAFDDPTLPDARNVVPSGVVRGVGWGTGDRIERDGPDLVFTADGPEGAERIVVDFADAALLSLGRLTADGSVLRTPDDQLPPGAAYCRITATARGDTLTRSPWLSLAPLAR